METTQRAPDLAASTPAGAPPIPSNEAAPSRGLLPVVPDTAPRQPLGLGQLALLSALWFGISYLWNPLQFFIMPILVDKLIHPTTVGAFTVDKNTYLALLETVGAVFAVVWQPAIGAISDRSRFRLGRRRPFIAVGVLGNILFLSLMTIVPSFGALLLVYCLLQASSNTAQGPYQGMLPDQVPDEQRGRASGLYGGLQMVALLLASVLIGLVLIPSGHLSLAILSIAGVLAVTGAMVVFGVSDVRTTGPAGGSLARSILLSFVVDVRRYPDFAWLMVSRLLFLISIAGVERFALYFIQDTFHLTSSDASKDTSYLLLAIVLVAALVSTTAGFLSERWGRKRLVAAACLVGAIGVALMITAHSLAAILLFGIVLGVATGIFLSVDWAFATDLIPKAEAGRYMGISNIATAGSGILAGIVFGPIIDFFNHAGGTAGTLGYQVMFGIAAAFYLIAMLTLRPVREIKVS